MFVSRIESSEEFELRGLVLKVLNFVKSDNLSD
jgi:hypothetical protein